MNRPELSIVVPILNERAQLPAFCADLARQQQVAFELVICDGGSTDGSLEWLDKETGYPFALQVCRAAAGRGRQLNAGTRKARSSWLLFLHVDSRFADSLALRKALDYLYARNTAGVAGHFALTFRDHGGQNAFGYYYHSWKARLGRPETIHGDQGFLLSRELFERLAGFCEDLPVMEDTDLAERLRQIGQWQLLPAEISTSARRFEREGLWQRQLLNALLMCFREIGWDEFFRAAPEVYRAQPETGKMPVGRFFTLVRHLLAEMPPAGRWRIWWRSGGYIRKHGWQLAFALDAHRAFRGRVPVGRGRMTRTDFCEPIYTLLTTNAVGQLLAMLLLRTWFEVTDRWLKSRESA